MSSKSEQEPEEAVGPLGKPEGAKDVRQGVLRFAQYTSPIMLAMLASAGKDMAFAQGSGGR